MDIDRPTESSLPRASLLSRVAGPLPTRMGDPIQPSMFPPSPFLRSVGFHALLPVIVQQPGVQLWAADDSAPLTADGDIDFTAHELYVFASGRWFGANRPGPPPSNGSLISTSGDPTTEAELESLLRDPSKAGRATSFIDRVRFTPPEIRCEFHNHALERWAEIKRENTKRFEPPPSKPVNTWRSWLKQMHEDATERGRSFIYCGIPRFEDEYQDAHIEGVKAIIALVPLTPKRFAVRGQIREPFLRAAAALLCEPEGYTRTIAQLNSTIAPTRSDTRYDETTFGKLATITPQTFARYAATIGVTAEEAETWRPWAMAYIAMELENDPTANTRQT
ncbi:hypothetical protein BC826DRAFT_975041 [Russula brevipes]|nr:hypothetical protein BC826DRAFT_975041 [Russula brevipes]